MSRVRHPYTAGDRRVEGTVVQPQGFTPWVREGQDAAMAPVGRTSSQPFSKSAMPCRHGARGPYVHSTCARRAAHAVRTDDGQMSLVHPPCRGQTPVHRRDGLNMSECCELSGRCEGVVKAVSVVSGAPMRHNGTREDRCAVRPAPGERQRPNVQRYARPFDRSMGEQPLVPYDPNHEGVLAVSRLRVALRAVSSGRPSPAGTGDNPWV